MPPTKMTSTRKFAVRLSLVTGSTLAAIIGAQSLAALDNQAAASPNTDVAAMANLLLADNAQHLPLLASTATNDPSVATVYAAPNITILRHPGQSAMTNTSSNNQTASTTASAIQPPSAVQIAPPSAVTVQTQNTTTRYSAPVRIRTRSSR